MAQIILVTGAFSSFGSLTARALGDAGHTVYASIPGTMSKSADTATQANAFSQEVGAMPYPNWTAEGVTWVTGFDFEIKAISQVPEPSVSPQV